MAHRATYIYVMTLHSHRKRSVNCKVKARLRLTGFSFLSNVFFVYVCFIGRKKEQIRMAISRLHFISGLEKVSL